MSDSSNRIAELNDALRRSPLDRTRGRLYITAGVRAHGPAFVTRAITMMMAFDQFNADNDPYHEHDFGAFEIGEVRLFFKIDYFDKRDPDLGAEDPSDPSTTERALTLMLADEY